MAGITKRELLAGGGLAVIAYPAPAGAAPAGGPFVTRHSGVFGGKPVDYIATVGETLVSGPDGRPTIRFVTTSYLAAGAPATRPVLFVFNGGPSVASATLHMLALGPKRISVAQDPTAPAMPPNMGDNPATVLDVADLVFIDPAETGFTRILPAGQPDHFYSAKGDAQSVSDFIVAWVKANGREASPKYVLGESYGTIRAALMAGQMARVMPLDGVFLLGQAVNMIETSQRANNALAYATNITALAAVAAYHGKAPNLRGKSPSQITDETYAWGMGEYLQALVRGADLDLAARQRIAHKLHGLTGISTDYYLAHDLAITKVAFATELLKDSGGVLAIYDGRYVGRPSSSGQPPLDGMSAIVEAVPLMMKQHLIQNLGVTWSADDYRDAAPLKETAWTWDATLGLGGPFLDYDYQAQISEAFRANPKFTLMIGNGYYDLTTTIGPARYLVTRSDYPRDRVMARQYVGGHTAYTHEPTLRAFTDDIRAWVTGQAS